MHTAGNCNRGTAKPYWAKMWKKFSENVRYRF